MPVLTLSIGSNIEPEKNIRRAVFLLRQLFPGLECSSVYESEAIGFAGDNFLNFVVATETDRDLTEISCALKGLEESLGRNRNSPRFSGRRIDVDILTYGDQSGGRAGLDLPRGEILENAYVLQPLAELLPRAIHPGTGKTFAKLWAEYDKSRQALWPVEFSWGGEDGFRNE